MSTFHVEEEDEESGFRSGTRDPLLPPQHHGTTESSSSAAHQRRHQMTFWNVVSMETQLSWPMTRRTLACFLLLIFLIFFASSVAVRTLFQYLFPPDHVISPTMITAGKRRDDAWAAVVSPFCVLACIYWCGRRSFQRLGPIAFLKARIRWSRRLFGPQSPVVAREYYRLGKVLEILSRPEEALEAYQTVVDRIPAGNPHAGGTQFYHAMGRLLYSLRRYEEALESFESSFGLLQKFQPKNTLRLHSEAICAAMTLTQMGDLDRAVEKHTEALQLLNDRGLSQTVDAATCLIFIGSTYESMGDLQAALERLEEALSIYLLNMEEFPRNAAVARVYDKIGSLQEKRGDMRAAADSYHLAIDVYRRGGRSDENRAVATLLRKVTQMESEPHA